MLRLGGLVVALGGIGDVVVHLAPPGAPAGAERLAHLVLFAGMALCLAGLARPSTRKERPCRSETS